MNKPYYNDSPCINKYSKIIRLKKSDICSDRKSWNDFYFSAESKFQESVSKQEPKKKTCQNLQELKKKAMSSRHSAYILSDKNSP